MANNCCLATPAPSSMTGVQLNTPTLRGELSLDTAAANSIVTKVLEVVSANTAVRDRLFNALWEAFRSSTAFTSFIAEKLRDPAFVKVVADNVMANQAFIDALVAKVAASLTTGDGFEAIKTCVIASIKRCDGSAHAEGDVIPTCDELEATVAAAVQDAMRRVANQS